MISLKCPKCGFFFCVDFPDDITEEEKAELSKCPCGAMMEEVEFDEKYIPIVYGG